MIDASFITSGAGLTPWAHGPTGGPRSGESFSRVLGDLTSGDDRAVVRKAAAQLVSSTFIMPLLQSLHESSFVGSPFAPGFAEQRFQPLLDQQVADRITSAADFPLIDVITDRLLGPDSGESP